MILADLIKDINVIDNMVDLNIEIHGIASDSRKVKKGYIFVAVKGENTNGNLYINDAIKNGAVAVVTDEKSEKNKYILVNNARMALSKMWSNYYDKPDKDINIIAITGTNGKTTTAYCLYRILRSKGIDCGLISTIECLINDEQINTNGGSDVLDKYGAMTTPDPEILYNIINKMKERRVKYLIMEASSHALEQHKLDFLNIEIGIFTNLSHDHLDYHRNMDNYFFAKQKLFKLCNIGIINIDDEYGKKLYKKYKGRMLSVSINENADFYAKITKCNSKGTEFVVFEEGNEIKIKSCLYGEINVYNLLLAIACTNALGIRTKEILNVLKSIKIKGRMEKYKNRNIFIDYAHTPKATESILKTARQIFPKRKIITLFGCGGDRDKEKRSEIGKICSEYSDYMILTSDNSRSESTENIIKDILTGIEKNKNFIVIENRCQAIEYAVKNTKKSDVLLLLGKGHENYEITNKGKIHFDEREVLSRILDNA
ncbi:MAG: UDP-N-acetylmuramoyl-L-alanyl-D-glutamate--2,6-diaminopimelate ligase [Clostridia bacterium]|nr:UDP-N-acetylmuramoyl-L-alanyl-D-glutamate--2,6-diaminopimelate ligase [Clostridia bacterium]